MNIISVLLKELKVKHSRYYVEENYVNAPDNDNMLGLQRVLSRYKIKTIGVHFHDKEEAGLSFPCILHWYNQFVVGVDFDDNKIKYHDGKQYRIEEVDIFNNRWTGDVLFVEDRQNAHEPSYKKNILIDLYKDFIFYFPFILVACLGFSSIIYNSFVSPSSVNMTFDLIGYAVCVLLFLKQFHTNNIFVNKVCSVLEKKGCDSVLESNEAKFLGIVSWTEIGLTYFSSRILFGCLYENSLSPLQIVGWLAMLYGFWSIWSQAFKIKHWCTLCCLIQMIIWGAGIYNFFVLKYIDFRYTDVAIFAICGMSSFVFIRIISSFHSVTDMYDMVNKDFLSFKIRNSIFNTALSESPEIAVKKEVSSIYYGNKSASTTLTVLTNPHCDPCAWLHKRLMDVIERNHNINIQYIYSSFNEKLDSSSLFCIAVYQQMPYNEAVMILEKWYQYGKFHREKFIKDIGVDIDKPEVLDEFSKHMEWKDRTGLDKTPTIIYAGHKLPEYYNVEDFIYLDSEG